MALGTITRVAVDQHSSSVLPVVMGDLKVTVTNVVGDSSYSTGGTALTAAQLGLSKVLFTIVSVTGSASNNGAVEASYNLSTGKLQMWATSGTSPVGLVEAGSVNLSGITVNIVAFGY